MNFILWGIYYGILLVTERFWLGKILEKNPVKWLNRLYTLAAVAVGWLFFRVESVSKGLVLLKAMVIPTAGGWNARIFANNRILFLLVLAVLFCGPLQQMFPGLKARLFDEDQVKASDIAVMLVLLILGTILMVSSTYQAFIYFKF